MPTWHKRTVFAEKQTTKQRKYRRMSLQILNAHNGERAVADPVSLTSLDAFKTWLSEATTIPAGNQILLTPAGKQAKFQALLTEREVFLYNRQVISGGSALAKGVTVSEFKPPSIEALTAAPDTLGDQNDLRAWQKLFDARRKWATELVDKSRSLARLADGHYDASKIIERGLGVALDNLQSHVRTLEGKFREAKDWGRQATEEQEELLSSLDTTTAQLSYLPAKKEFFHFLAKLGPPDEDGTPKRRSSVTGASLASFARPDMVKNSTSTVEKARQSIIDRLGKIESSVNKVTTDAGELISAVEQEQAQSAIDSGKAAMQLMEEIEVVAKKIASDHEHILTLPASSKSLSQASKMALLHTRNYLPTLREYFTEMTELLEHATRQRNNAMPNSMTKMQQIARVEASFAQVNTQLMSLDMSSDAENSFDYISALSQLPFVYGSLLIEAVRRKEWSDRLKDESATLAEDIAGYREEEERRRRKWFNNMGYYISRDANGGEALSFELNLQAGTHEWPEATREDVSVYLEALKDLQSVEKEIEDLSEAFKDLDRPTKRQIKKANGFKMGSFHEASNSKGSFLLRENDEMRVMKDANTKLEDELRSQKSRVRKLEDLLYKQSQSSRSASGNVFQLADGQRLESATPEYGTARPDVTFKSPGSIRPVSGMKFLEDSDLARRIVILEAELQDERQRRVTVETEAQSRNVDHDLMKNEIEESRSTKKDLMANMDAQQREFAHERRLLQDQVNEGKIKIEELDEELDRVLATKDNEKADADEKIRSTETALTNAKNEIERRDDSQAEYRNTLLEIRERLTPENSAPQSIAEILEELDELADRSARQAKDLSYNLSTAKADKESLQATLERQEKELLSVKDEITSLEHEITVLRDETSTERARATSLSAELEDGRNQLRTLRAKFAEGETGSEALRLRVEEEASRASNLATELAQSKSHVNSLDVELLSLQTRHQKLQAESALTSKRLENRSVLDRELTNRIVATNEELARLLESLGLSIIYRDGVVSIQRTSKLMNQSTSASLNPQADLSTLIADGYDVTPDVSLLQWMQADNIEEETALFNSLLSKVSTFNLTTFAEAIIKLRRDVEWTGKKWKQEARNYRDKFHRAQNEAHDKIAFRSFKEGDLALFLPTRNQATRPWAAFNVGAPHYFLRETDAHKLQNREWLVARISKMEERIVDLSRTISANDSKPGGRPASVTEASDGGFSVEDDNPFELSDGLRWYLLDAAEEKSGAPATPGLGKSTVASANVEVKGSIRMKKSEKGHDASGKLNKSLESRRSSNASKRGSISGVADDVLAQAGIVRNSSATHLRPPSRSSAAGATAPAAGSQAAGAEVSPQQHRPPPSGSDEQYFSNAYASLPSAPPSFEPGSASRSRPSPLGFFGSASPPIPSWLGPAGEISAPPPEPPKPSTNRAAHAGGVRKAAPSPSRGGGVSQSPARSAGGGPASASGTPTKSVRPAPRPPQTAWESLWSLDIASGVEGSTGAGKGRK